MDNRKTVSERLTTLETNTTNINSDLNIERLNMFGTHTLNDMRLDAYELTFNLKKDNNGNNLNLVNPLPNINYVDQRFNDLEAATAGN